MLTSYGWLHESIRGVKRVNAYLFLGSMKGVTMFGGCKGQKHKTIKIHANSTANKLRHRRDDSKGITSYNVRGSIGPVCPQNPPKKAIKRYLLRDISDEYTIAKLYRMQISNLEGMWGFKEVIEKLVELEAQAYKAAKELEMIVKRIPD